MLLTRTRNDVDAPLGAAPRRVFALLLGILTMSLASIAPTFAQTDEIVEGTHYQRLPVAVETADDNTVEVVEMFSYACVHCFNFDPVVEAWHARQGDDVTFLRVPAVFNTDWELLAQAFYTAETLGVTDAIHTPMFEGIHITRQDLRQPDLLRSCSRNTRMPVRKISIPPMLRFRCAAGYNKPRPRGAPIALPGCPA